MGPCERAEVLAYIKARYGRPCPYIELDPDNAVAMELLSMLMSPDLTPMWKSTYDALCDGMTGEERSAILFRVAAARQDTEVVGLISAALDREHERALSAARAVARKR